MRQLVLPGMRDQRWGKIVNLSSIGGKLTLPGGGYYHASKYAVEAFTDALRYEVARFGIDAILIEPGFIRTHFFPNARAPHDTRVSLRPFSQSDHSRRLQAELPAARLDIDE